MRVYMHTDMEGMAGLGDGTLIADRSSDEFRRYAELFWREVNAAATGLLAGGATEIRVLDSHRVEHLDPALLDPRLRFEGNSKQIWWGSLDDTWDATCFIGAHAMSGTQGGFLEHTQTSDWYRYVVIGRAKPFVIPKPSTIRWEFCRCAPADAAEGLPGVRRVGPRAVEKTVTHAGYSVLPGLLRCQAYPGETSHNGVKVIGPAGTLPPGSVG